MPRFPPHVSKPTGAQLSGGNERMEGGGQEPGAPGAGSLGSPACVRVLLMPTGSGFE